MDEAGAARRHPDLYVYASGDRQKVPLQSISSIEYEMTEKIRRATSSAPSPCRPSRRPASAVGGARWRRSRGSTRFAALPATVLEIGGEHEEQVKSFKTWRS